MKKLYLFLFLLTICITGTTCGKDEIEQKHSLINTKWKLISMVNVSTATTQIPEMDSENRYWIIFNRDNTLEGKSCSNALFGNYVVDSRTSTVQIMQFGGTKVGECSETGNLFWTIIPSVRYFIIEGMFLKLYHNETDYWLFKAII